MHCSRVPLASIFAALLLAFGLWPQPLLAQAPRPSVFQTTLEEPDQLTPEITTEQLLAILAARSEPVFDVRTAKEYAIAHIPGTINIYEKEVARIAELYPKKDTAMVLYCNGPSCGKSKRTSEQLVALGYTNVRRYQLGLPVWRALSQTVQTDMAGLAYVYAGDKTSVFVDARSRAEFATATIPGAVSVQAGEATAANDDGRLPFQDKGTRIVVFANSPEQARVVAAEVAKKAYWNSSYFGGTFMDLVAAGYINHPPVAISKNATVGAGAQCTATIAPAIVDAGSFDPDAADPLALSVNPSEPLPFGNHMVTLTATDSHGRSSSSASTVTVVDETAPSLGNVTVDKSMLWPPDHLMELVTIAYSASDNCGAVDTQLVVSMSDAGSSASGGSIDWEVVDAHHVKLRAERSGGADRTYFITVVATDGAGNQSAGSAAVRVPASGR
jgi:rhodanese-related sulfurtransferase